MFIPSEESGRWLLIEVPSTTPTTIIAR